VVGQHVVRIDLVGQQLVRQHVVRFDVVVRHVGLSP
jgi:hypothetical protein